MKTARESTKQTWVVLQKNHLKKAEIAPEKLIVSSDFEPKSWFGTEATTWMFSSKVHCLPSQTYHALACEGSFRPLSSE